LVAGGVGKEDILEDSPEDIVDSLDVDFPLDFLDIVGFLVVKRVRLFFNPKREVDRCRVER
jgi:hypothetical protein